MKEGDDRGEYRGRCERRRMDDRTNISLSLFFSGFVVVLDVFKTVEKTGDVFAT